MYMMWFDDNAKKPTSTKIAEAIAAYKRHFKTQPNVVLVNAAEAPCEVAGASVRVASYVRRHNYWVGIEEPAQ